MGINKRFASEEYVTEQISSVETKQTTLVEDVAKLSEEKADKAYIDNYLLNIDYDNLLKFDITEIVFDKNTSSILGKAILGQLILA